MRHLSICIVFVLFSSTAVLSQIYYCNEGINPYTEAPCTIPLITTLNFLQLPFNPQSTGIGGSGIAILPSLTSVNLNSSNLAFIESKFGVQASYVFWYKQRGNKKVYITPAITGYAKLGKNSALGASFRYSNSDRFVYIDSEGGGSIGSPPPKAWEGLLSYNQKLSPNFAVGLSLKYIRSQANSQISDGTKVLPINTGAGDLSFTFRKPLKIINKKATIVTGLAIRNVGPKVTYLENRYRSDFLPTNLGLGLGYIHKFEEQHTLTVTGEVNRLLVPTPSNTNEEGQPLYYDFQEKTAIQGMISSFSDAPNGASEDFQENNYSIGAEYRYQFIIARLGHFNEHRTKGNRKILTGGIGFRFNGIGVDLAYAANLNLKLNKSFQIAVSYNLEKQKEQEKI